MLGEFCRELQLSEGDFKSWRGHSDKVEAELARHDLLIRIYLDALHLDDRTVDTNLVGTLFVDLIVEVKLRRLVQVS